MTTRTILCALDLGETSEQVFSLAVEHARALGARLVLAHVVPDVAVVFPEARVATPAHPSGTPQEPLMIDQARSELERWSTRAADESLDVTEIVVEGVPASTLVDLADAHEADLIVLGTHGRRGLARVLMGSVAEAVLRHATVPVLVVRTADPG